MIQHAMPRARCPVTPDQQHSMARNFASNVSVPACTGSSATRSQAARRPAIRPQAHGKSVVAFHADRTLALDERLTRQFEKTIAMLIRPRELHAAKR